MELDLNILNENQRNAVEWNGNSLLVLAGPGSGKTKVLTMRVAKLLLDSPTKKFKVLGLTFTNKAAAEMKKRVEEIIPQCVDRILLTTFHSFCADILRQHGSHVGIKPDFIILNQDVDRESLLEEAINEVRAQGNDLGDVGTSILSLIDRLICDSIDEADIRAKLINTEIADRAIILLQAYLKKEIESNRLDFSTLILLTEKLLNEKPIIAQQIRTTYNYICVDEFQDTNFSQYKVLKLIAGKTPKNLFVVADDDQIIYQWNGASPERLQQLKNDYEMSIIQLPANYRCPAEVIELANCLIKYNEDRSPNKQPICAIKAKREEEIVRLIELNSENEEMDWVANDIANKHKNEINKCVVLARTKKLLELSPLAFEKVGLKAYLTVKKAEFVSAPFRFLHGVLRLANSRTDKEQLRKICKAFFEIEGIDIHVKDVISEASQNNNDYLRTWFLTVAVRSTLSNATKEYLKKAFKLIVEKIEFLNFVKESKIWFKLINTAISSTDNEGFTDYEQELLTWNDLQGIICNKYSEDDLTLNSFLQELDLSEKAPIMPNDAIKCLTIHSSKGLEFEHVYLVGMAEDQLPSYQSIKKGDLSREMQEERRNCFVAITRCQSTLTLTYAKQYFGWNKKPSRFLVEMNIMQ